MSGDTTVSCASWFMRSWEPAGAGSRSQVELAVLGGKAGRLAVARLGEVQAWECRLTGWGEAW